jgi:HD-like signal output (HDOD) protein
MTNGSHDLERVLAYVRKMPALPVTVSKVVEICNLKETSPVDLNKVISMDPVLMARVLKLINSAYYGLPQKVTSLVRAIIMLGINTVKNLALSTAVLDNLGNPEAFRSLNLQGFWRHSLSVGVLSKMIAKRCGVGPKEIEEYFISGLLHDIGKIPINAVFPDRYLQLISTADRARTSLFRIERESFGFDHGIVGRSIGGSWNLGGYIQDCIEFHHTPEEYSGEHQKILYIVSTANYFANLAEFGYSGDRYPEAVPEDVMNNLGISMGLLDEIEDDVQAEIDKAEIFLRSKR